MAFRTFLASRNIEFSLRRYGIDALNFMALGLFSSLIIGLILKTVGGWLDWPWLIEVGKQAQGATVPKWQLKSWKNNKPPTKAA